jgi:hypothetical protein
MSFYDFVRRATVSCANCTARSDQLLQCPCRTAFYCDSTCQVEHWPTHKHSCTHTRKAARPQLHRCDSCGEPSMQLHSCQCGAALYCNVACQLEHWNVHRDVCGCWSFYFERVHSKYKDVAAQTDECPDDSSPIGVFGDLTLTEGASSGNLRSSSNNDELDNDDDDLNELDSEEHASRGAGSSAHSSMRLGEASSSLRGSFRHPAAGRTEEAMAPRVKALLTRAASSVRRSVTEIFFNTARQQKSAGHQSEEHRRQVLAQHLVELANVEEDNRRRLQEEAAADAEELAAAWRVLHGPRLIQLCCEHERNRRLRIVAEYNLWAKQTAKLRHLS